MCARVCVCVRVCILFTSLTRDRSVLSAPSDMLPKYLQQLQLQSLLPRWTQMNMATDYIWDWDWGIADWPSQPATLPTSLLTPPPPCFCLARTPAAASNKFSSSFAIAIEIDPDLECWMYRMGGEGKKERRHDLCCWGRANGRLHANRGRRENGESHSRFQFQFRNCFRFYPN